MKDRQNSKTQNDRTCSVDSDFSLETRLLAQVTSNTWTLCSPLLAQVTSNTWTLCSCDRRCYPKQHTNRADRKNSSLVLGVWMCESNHSHQTQ